jgi:hypothetical protein
MVLKLTYRFFFSLGDVGDLVLVTLETDGSCVYCITSS